MTHTQLSLWRSAHEMTKTRNQKMAQHKASPPHPQPTAGAAQEAPNSIPELQASFLTLI